MIEAATKYIVGHADANLGAVTANARTAQLIDNAKEGLGTVSARKKPIWLCAACARSMCGCAIIIRQASRWPAGWPTGPRWPASSIRRSKAIPAMRFGSAIITRRLGLFSADSEAVPAKRRWLRSSIGLELFGMGYSWGGYESLDHSVRSPQLSHRHAGRPKAQPCALHIGLDDIDDLKADLTAAFERLNAATA